MKSEMASFAV